MRSISLQVCQAWQKFRLRSVLSTGAQSGRAKQTFFPQGKCDWSWSLCSRCARTPPRDCDRENSGLKRHGDHQLAVHVQLDHSTSNGYHTSDPWPIFRDQGAADCHREWLKAHDPPSRCSARQSLGYLLSRLLWYHSHSCSVPLSWQQQRYVTSSRPSTMHLVMFASYRLAFDLRPLPSAISQLWSGRGRTRRRLAPFRDRDHV